MGNLFGNLIAIPFRNRKGGSINMHYAMAAYTEGELDPVPNSVRDVRR